MLAPTSSTSTASASAAGVEYGFGTGTVGIAGNYSRPRAKFVGNVSRDEADASRSAASAASRSPGASPRPISATAGMIMTSTAKA